MTSDPFHDHSPARGFRALRGVFAALAAALALTLFSHVVNCACDEDHVSVAASADENAVAAIMVQPREPGSGASGCVKATTDAVTGSRPSLAARSSDPGGVTVPVRLRNSALAHRQAVVLLI